MSFEQQMRAIKTPETDTSTFRHLYYRLCWWLEDNNPFTRYVYVKSSIEYMDMPRKKRTYLYFWYLDAIITDSNILLGRKSERDDIDTFLKYCFPMQYWLRENGFSLKCKLSRAYDWVRYKINPRQKWLKKQIPDSWCDKVSLVKDLNFAMIVHFIEGEKCFDNTDYEGSSESHIKFAKELRECYEYIKNERPRLDKIYWDSFPKDDAYTGDYNVDYADVNRLEKEIEDKDTKWLTWIVNNRGFLWT